MIGDPISKICKLVKGSGDPILNSSGRRRSLVSTNFYNDIDGDAASRTSHKHRLRLIAVVRSFA